jgi:hypothetical protein
LQILLLSTVDPSATLTFPGILTKLTGSSVTKDKGVALV